MKEATGELSTTVIAIVAIAAILAIFTAFLLPTLRDQIALSQACAGGPGYSTSDGKICCENVTSTKGTGCTKTDGASKTCSAKNNTVNNTEFKCYVQSDD